MLSCSCVNLLDLAYGILEDYDGVAVKEIVNIQCACKGGLNAGNVACRAVNDVVLLGKDEENLLAGLKSVDDLDHFLSLDVLKSEAVEDYQLIVLNLRGEGGLDSKSSDLLIDVLVIITGLGAVRDTAVIPLRSSGRTLSCAAGALLSPGLLTAAADFCSGKSRLCALTLICQIADYAEMHSRDAGRDSENAFCKLKVGNLFTCHVKN